MTKEQKFSHALAIQVERRIFLVRGQKVMLDTDLAQLYRVPTKSLNLAVKRNADRFPGDFMFQLTDDEAAGLRFHFETSKPGRGGRRYLPYAFTEQGVAMLSSVLRSARAVEVNIAIMRTFVQLRRLMDTNHGYESRSGRKIESPEKKDHEQHHVRGRRWVDCIGRLVRRPSDWETASQFAEVFAAIKELITLPTPAKKQIGFHP